MPTPGGDDRELLDRCLARAPGSWEEFLLRFRPAILASAAATLRAASGTSREDDVQAVVGAVLLQLVENEHAALRAFEGRSSLAGYLRAITARVALNQLRSEGRHGWLRFRPLEEISDAPAKAAESDDGSGMQKMLAALDRLPPRDRLILKLFHLDGASYKDIAALMGLPFNTVSPTLIRARAKLRALFGGER